MLESNIETPKMVINSELSNQKQVSSNLEQKVEIKIIKEDKQHMTSIELSTDMENPTEILDYINKSGVYVAENTGLLSFQGELLTILAKGQFFEVQNHKDLGKIIGEEISDEDNVIIISIPSIEGYMCYFIYQNGEWYDSINITSQNINDYISIDTSNLIKKSQLNSAYGIQFTNNQLAIVPATTNEIDKGQALYKVITSSNISYAIEQKGKNYFPTKEELQDIQNNVDELVTDIEAILDMVVSVNE